MARNTPLIVENASYYVEGVSQPYLCVCQDDDEYAIFLETLEETIQTYEWTLHAFSLTPEAYYLLVDTPHDNLPECMRYFQGTYSNRIHRRRNTCGHFFKPYAAKLIETTGENLASVSTAVHLKPIRKRSITDQQKALIENPYSSFSLYISPSERPAWLSVQPVLNALGFPDNRSGLTCYRNLLIKLLAEGSVTAGSVQLHKQNKALQTDWAIGSNAFKDSILDLLGEKLKRVSIDSIPIAMKNAYQLRHAEQQLHIAMDAVGLTGENLEDLKKQDPRKQAVCWYMKRETHAASPWLAQRLHIGIPSGISRFVRNVEEAIDGPLLDLRNTLEKITP
jgi:hypothetical protein